jgi:hypothetical protein
MSAFASYGLTVDRINDEKTEVWISVPENSEHVNAEGVAMAGECLAKRISEMLKEFRMPMKVHYRIRKGENWTKEQGEHASEAMINEMYGRGN